MPVSGDTGDILREKYTVAALLKGSPGHFEMLLKGNYC
jgi:hypothetical protein